MNWTGGSLQRHSKSKGSTARVQGMQFAKTEPGGPASRTARLTSSSLVSGNGEKRRPEHLHTDNHHHKRQCTGTSKYQTSIMPRAVTNSVPDSFTTSHSSSSTLSEPSSTSNLDVLLSCNRHFVPDTLSPAIITVNEVRQNLLKKSNWIGMPSKKPLQTFIHPKENSLKIGRRREIKIVASNGHHVTLPTRPSRQQGMSSANSYSSDAQFPPHETYKLSSPSHPVARTLPTTCAAPKQSFCVKADERERHPNSIDRTSAFPTYFDAVLDTDCSPQSGQHRKLPLLTECRQFDSFDRIKENAAISQELRKLDENGKYERELSFKDAWQRYDTANTVPMELAKLSQCYLSPTTSSVAPGPHHTNATSSSDAFLQPLYTTPNSNTLQERFIRDKRGFNTHRTPGPLISQIGSERDDGCISERSNTNDDWIKNVFLNDSASMLRSFHFENTPSRCPTKPSQQRNLEWKFLSIGQNFNFAGNSHTPKLPHPTPTVRTPCHNLIASTFSMAWSNMPSSEFLGSEQASEASTRQYSTPSRMRMFGGRNPSNPSRFAPVTQTISKGITCTESLLTRRLEPITEDNNTCLVEPKGNQCATVPFQLVNCSQPRPDKYNPFRGVRISGFNDACAEVAANCPFVFETPTKH